MFFELLWIIYLQIAFFGCWPRISERVVMFQAVIGWSDEGIINIIDHEAAGAASHAFQSTFPSYPRQHKTNALRLVLQAALYNGFQ